MKAELTKLVEVLQYTIFAFIISFIGGSYLDSLFEEVDQNITNSRLIISTLLHICIMVIGIYYMRKVLIKIPFLLPLDNNENDEKLLGTILGIGMIFNPVQINFQNKLELLRKRFYR